MKTKQELKDIFVTGAVITESMLYDLIEMLDSITECQYEPTPLISTDGWATLSPTNGALQIISLSEDTTLIEEGWDASKIWKHDLNCAKHRYLQHNDACWILGAAANINRKPSVNRNIQTA